MAEVTSYTKAYLDSVVGSLVQTGTIDDEGNMTFTTQDGTVIPVGTVLESVPTASTTTPGAVELATTSEATTGTDTAKAVTAAGVAAAIADKQDSDSDLTAIAGLTPANDDFVQRKSGAWANRTVAQVSADVDATGYFTRVRTYSGSAYSALTGVRVYIGTPDPSVSETVVNGSVWFEI